MLGLVHISRRKLDSHLLTRAIDHVETRYGVPARDIRVGITPGISKEYHTLTYIGLSDSEGWAGFLETESDGLIHVDMLGYALQQLRERGVRRIIAYSDCVCTFRESLLRGVNISYSFADAHGETEQRILVAARL